MPDPREPRYQRSESAIFSTIAGEVVALDVQAGQCFGFNGVASAVWELLETPRSVDEICNSLRDRFDVGEAECRVDVEQLLATLTREGIAIVSSADD